MKKTQIKDALRNIWKQKISFLSIAVIAALGVAMFLGIDFSASAIRKNAGDFYSEKNYRDIELLSTLLLSEDDMDAVRRTEGVADAEGVFLTDARAFAHDTRQTVQVLSCTERINLPILYEGRLPESAAECAVEKSVAETLQLKPGDSVVITDKKGGTAPYLKQTAFTVTGIVLHPDHVCSSVPFTPYILTAKDAFDAESLDDCRMAAEIVTDRAADVGRFSDAYRETVSEVLARLEKLGTTRSAIREAEVHTQAENTLDENRDKLTDAEAELARARTELDDGWKKLNDGGKAYTDGVNQLADARKELDDAKAQLIEGEQSLIDARAQLDDAKAQLEAGKAELDEAEAKLSSGRSQLVSGWNQLEDVKTRIRNGIRSALENFIGEDSSGWIHWASPQKANPDKSDVSADDFRITENFTFHFGSSLSGKIRELLDSVSIPDRVLRIAFEKLGGEGEYDPDAAYKLIADRLASAAGKYQSDYDAIAGGCAQWDAGHKTYLRGRTLLRQGQEKYNDGLAEYEAGEAQYAEGLQKYEDGLKAYQDGEAKYEQGVKDLEDAAKQLEDARQKLTDGEAQYADGLNQLKEGSLLLKDAEERVASIGVCKWILMDPTGNASYAQFDTASGNLKSMQMTFSLLFVLVGALVIYATISKMVDEQRTLVGTTKALGFYNREIFLKYLLFGVTATVLGAALGLIAGLTVIQSFALNGYNNFFDIDLLRHTSEALPTVAVFAAGILLAVAAILFATRKLMKETAIRLMQPAVPKGAKRSSVRKPRLSLYSRLILLNIRTDLRRVLVTVVSVAGCCALVVIGMTLRHAVYGAEKNQFEGIITHDGVVNFDTASDPKAGETLAAYIADAGAKSVPAMHTYVTVHIQNLDMQELYCGDLAAISEMFALRDAKTNEPLSPTDDGILVTKRFCELYDMQVGDTFEITRNGTETVKVRIAAAFDCYLSRNLFISEAYYRTLFHADPEPNMLYVQLNGANSQTLIKSLLKVDGFMSYRTAGTERELFTSATSALNGIVLLFIGMAGVMAGVVLMNLTNIYIMQKKRELTVMRINGFTVREVKNYVLRETVITTTLGIVLGIAIGTFIGYRIIRSLEQSYMQLERGVSLFAWLTGALITAAFTAIVNMIALRKIRNLKLTDI